MVIVPPGVTTLFRQSRITDSVNSRRPLAKEARQNRLERKGKAVSVTMERSCTIQLTPSTSLFNNFTVAVFLVRPDHRVQADDILRMWATRHFKVELINDSGLLLIPPFVMESTEANKKG